MEPGGVAGGAVTNGPRLTLGQSVDAGALGATKNVVDADGPSVCDALTDCEPAETGGTVKHPLKVPSAATMSVPTTTLPRLTDTGPQVAQKSAPATAAWESGGP